MPKDSTPAGHPSPDPTPSVLAFIADKTGEEPRVSLPDTDASGPLIDPASDETRATPRGRGTYQLMGEIARGGMGVVLRGHDTDLGRDIAMKVLHKDLAADDSALQRFVEEAQIGGQLQHPGIVPVYELGLMDDERPYFTMKLVKGQTLAALFDARASTDDNRAQLVAVFAAVCQTMAYAHSRGVIHRDLKPSNVMVGAFGEVQVVDWGLAKVLARGGAADDDRSQHTPAARTVIDTVRSKHGSGSSRSVAGSVMGTPAYMPPEQASGQVEQLDQRSDVFSLGALLCELLTGAPPYPGEFADAIQNAARAKLDDAHGRLDRCTAAPELVELARQCLTPAKAARPRDAGQVVGRVREHLDSSEERARTAQIDAAVQRRAKWLWSAMVALVLLFVGAGLAYTEWLESQELQERLDNEQELFGARLEATNRLNQARASASPETWDAALQAAQRAAVIAQTHALPQRDEIDALAAEVESERQGFLEDREREAAQAHFYRRLEEVVRSRRLAGMAGGLDKGETVYPGVFALLAIDPVHDTREAVVGALGEAGATPGSERAELVAEALDDWAVPVLNAAVRERLLDLANAIDSEPFRMKLRRVAIWNDRGELLRLASSPEALEASPVTVMMLSLLLGRNDAIGDLVPILDAARENHPQDFRMNALLGIVRLYLGTQPTEVLPYFTSMEALRPDDLAARIWRAGLLAGIGQTETALTVFDHALALHRGEELRGYVEVLGNGFRRGGHGPAGEAFEQLLRQRTQHAEVRTALGSLLKVRGQWQEAAGLLRDALPEQLEAGVPDPGLIGDLSYSLTMMGEHAEAHDVLRRALRIRERVYLIHRLTWLLSNCPDPALRAPEEALALAERANELEPDVEVLMEALAAALYRSGRYEEALGVLYAISDLHRSELRVPAACYRAMALFRLGDRELAREALREARLRPEKYGYDDYGSVMRRTTRVLREEAQALIEGS